MFFVAQELREIMASLGIRTVHELIGRTDLLEVNDAIKPWKAKGIDFSKILYKPEVPGSIATRCITEQNHKIAGVMDTKLINIVKEALEKKQHVKIDLPIKNTDRTVGAMLSGGICKRYGEGHFADETIHVRFKGIAGQSFGAFLAKGITFELEGLANDYVGKGLSGGKMIIYPDRAVTYAPEENIIIGNTACYGGTGGEAYIHGKAGERFCIRNSGINAVVEGLGDHGCEYMTGGIVLVLGKTGRNFAAGMSGGTAYVYDEDGSFKTRCNMEMVNLEVPTEEELETVRTLAGNHKKYTTSRVAGAILEKFSVEKTKFVKVMPIEYKKVLEARKLKEAESLSEVSDG
ncbi:MAG: glutamate synthase subunit alpha, partial [Candidatus Omnitrophica bacterium]|nr:glutamate synthase subunit alpha [Candidatus Omnitrophota bacterium]